MSDGRGQENADRSALVATTILLGFTHITLRAR
jgi:hypothetical protein